MSTLEITFLVVTACTFFLGALCIREGQPWLGALCIFAAVSLNAAAPHDSKPVTKCVPVVRVRT